MGPISSDIMKEILEQMVNSLSEWFYSHRLITRQQARKSTMRICFILAKQANRKAFIFFFLSKGKVVLNAISEQTCFI